MQGGINKPTFLGRRVWARTGQHSRFKKPTSFTVIFAARFCKAAKGRKLSVNEHDCSGWVPALKAAAVYSLDPASDLGRGWTHPAAHPVPWEKGPWHTPALRLLPLPLPTCRCDSSRPYPSLPAWYFSAWLRLSLPRNSQVSCPHVPACTRAPTFAISPLAPRACLALNCSGCLAAPRIYLHAAVFFCSITLACLSPRPPSSACLHLCLHLYIPLHRLFLSR